MSIEAIKSHSKNGKHQRLAVAKGEALRTDSSISRFFSTSTHSLVNVDVTFAQSDMAADISGFLDMLDNSAVGAGTNDEHKSVVCSEQQFQRVVWPSEGDGFDTAVFVDSLVSTRAEPTMQPLSTVTDISTSVDVANDVR